METVKTEAEIEELIDNKIIGDVTFENSKVDFLGKGNLILCKGKVTLQNCVILFENDNSLIYLRGGVLHAFVMMGNNCVMYNGLNNYFNPYGSIFLKCSEQKHIFIGDGCLCSGGVEINTSDSHLIYSIDTRKRINYSKSIFIGDRVWIGQNVLILKGSKVHSGAVLGANSVCAGKTLLSNSLSAGNPCRIIKHNIFWLGHYVHSFVDEDTNFYSSYTDADSNIFEYNADEYMPFDELDDVFSRKIMAEEKAKIVDEKILDKYNRFSFKG